GASAVCPENTVAAFVEARRQGADMVELDARLTADGVVVVHHDPVVEGVGQVSQLDATDLPDWLPTLETALAACDGMGVNVELKHLPHEPDFDPDHRISAAVVDVVRAAAMVDRVLLSSFDLAAVDAARRLD